MKTLKLISIIVGIVAVLGGIVAGPITAYWKLQLEMEAKFAARNMATQKMHEEIIIELHEIGNHVEWTEASVEVLAEKIPQAIEMHEYKMHPKEYHSPSSPTQIVIKLPKRPSKKIR